MTHLLAMAWAVTAACVILTGQSPAVIVAVLAGTGLLLGAAGWLWRAESRAEWSEQDDSAFRYYADWTREEEQ